MTRSVKYFLIVLLISAPHFWQRNLNAQSIFLDSKGAIGIAYSGLGDHDAFYFQGIIGGGDYDGRGQYSLGITYIYLP